MKLFSVNAYLEKKKENKRKTLIQLDWMTTTARAGRITNEEAAWAEPPLMHSRRKRN